MRKKTTIILLVTILSLIELILIKPIIPPFYGMNIVWKAIYIFFLFGFPILIAIPISILVGMFTLVIKGKINFKFNWLNYFLNTFLFFSIMILILNSILFISKINGIDPFPLIKWTEIKAYNGTTNDLYYGDFESRYGKIKRFKDRQVETHENGEITNFDLIWISKNEYRLINKGKNLGMNDTIDVKITNNTKEYYECYLRFGEYAKYEIIKKK